MRIVLDSNVICRDFLLSGKIFRLFFEGLTITNYTLYIPQLVIDEVKNKYVEQLQGSKVKIEREWANLTKFLALPPSFQLDDAYIEAEIEQYYEILNSRFSNAGAIIVDYPPVPHQMIVERMSSRKSPFLHRDFKEVGYKDYLIWETVVSIAERVEDKVVFITEDKKAFSDYSDDTHCLHSDLVEDLKERGLEPNRIVLYIGLKSFVGEHLEPRITLSEEIRSELSRGEYLGIDLRKEIQELEPGDIPHWSGFLVEPTEIGLPPEFEDPIIWSFLKVSSIKIGEVRPLSSGDILVSVKAEAWCEIQFVVPKDVTTAMDEEVFVLSEFDSRHDYALIGRNLNVELSLTINTTSGKITSLEIESASAQ